MIKTIQDGIAEIVLSRPEALNAIDPELRDELVEAWRGLDSDETVSVLIVTGAGDRSFCVGSDLKKTPPPPESAASLEFGRTSDRTFLGFPESIPTIAAINGYAMGGGLELALLCDIRIAVTTATFALPEVRVGSIPGAGGTQRLPRVVGTSAAMQLILTGGRIDAAEALRLGLVSEVVEPDRLLPRAREIAAEIAANPPLQVRALKRLVSRALEVPLHDGIDTERYVWGLLRDTEDRLEGRRAFAEKRKPNYRGR